MLHPIPHAVLHIGHATVLGLRTVWSLWGNPGMARCRKKSALAIGYIQKPKALLASSSGISGFNVEYSREGHRVIS